MNHSRVFVRVSSDSLRDALSLEVADYVISTQDVGEPWVDDATAEQFDLLVIDAGMETEESLARLCESPLLYHCECIFLSDGTPNTGLDLATQKS